MKIPKVEWGEQPSAYVSRCVRVLTGEGVSSEEAREMCVAEYETGGEYAEKWWNTERKRIKYERWAVNMFNNALKENVAEFLNAKTIEEYKRAKTDKEPIKEAYKKLYLKVGAPFYQEAMNNIRDQQIELAKKNVKTLMNPRYVEYQIHAHKNNKNDRRYGLSYYIDGTLKYGNWDEFVEYWIDAGAGEKIVQVDATQLAWVRTCLKNSMKEEEGLEGAQERIRENLFTTKTRARRIARTEIVRAQNMADYTGVMYTGVDCKKVWLANKDSRTRRHSRGDMFDHTKMDMKHLDLFAQFICVSNQGGTDKIQFPADPVGHPANVINCRCTLIYQVGTSDNMGMDDTVLAGLTPRSTTGRIGEPDYKPPAKKPKPLIIDVNKPRPKPRVLPKPHKPKPKPSKPVVTAPPKPEPGQKVLMDEGAKLYEPAYLENRDLTHQSRPFGRVEEELKTRNDKALEDQYQIPYYAVGDNAFVPAKDMKEVKERLLKLGFKDFNIDTMKITVKDANYYLEASEWIYRKFGRIYAVDLGVQNADRLKFMSNAGGRGKMMGDYGGGFHLMAPKVDYLTAGEYLPSVIAELRVNNFNYEDYSKRVKQFATDPYVGVSNETWKKMEAYERWMYYKKRSHVGAQRGGAPLHFYDYDYDFAGSTMAHELIHNVDFKVHSHYFGFDNNAVGDPKIGFTNADKQIDKMFNSWKRGLFRRRIINEARMKLIKDGLLDPTVNARKFRDICAKHFGNYTKAVSSGSELPTMAGEFLYSVSKQKEYDALQIKDPDEFQEAIDVATYLMNTWQEYAMKANRDYSFN